MVTPDKIRAARLERGHTQKQAAATILHTERAWQDWEQGCRKMHPALWWLYLHGGIPQPPSCATTADSISD